MDYSVVMPSAQAYCESMGNGNSFYGMVLSAYPLARILVLPIAGMLADRWSMRLGLLLTVALQIAGCALYGSAQASGHSLLLLLGRLLAGCGSTNNAMAQKFVISTSYLRD